jgi:flavin-dependent dehydrogenase
VVLLEQSEDLPQNKYWLTDGRAVSDNPLLEVCVDRRYEFLDFVAYDGLAARVRGKYLLWDTSKLVGRLVQDLATNGAQMMTGHRLYSVSQGRDSVVVRANSQSVRARLLVDCMGFGSPLASAKNIVTIAGYYIMHGCEIILGGEVPPVALDNVIIDRHPAFLELFPTSKGTAHAAIILPSQHYSSGRRLREELHFILHKSHYAQHVTGIPEGQKSYFGIIPVGRLRQPALDRIVFFGEAGQANPAASATGLSRMLRTYRGLADAIIQCLKQDTLNQRHLLSSIPPYMTRMNRVFQENLFESLLSFSSDDFRRLVQDLAQYPGDLINDLVFAEFDFSGARTLRLAADAVLRPRSVLGPHVLKSIARFVCRKR